MTLSKSKSKSKSSTKPGTTFSVNGWDSEMAALMELPNFFETPGWRDYEIPLPPDPDETETEIVELLSKQKRLREDPSEWLVRKAEIEAEANDDAFYLRRLVMLTPLGSSVSTEVLIEAMFHLGFIVVANYKKKFMRPRPSHIEPRLRPLINVPRFPAYPSGHALQYFLAAKALSTVINNDDLSIELFKVARRIAENREWAGLHYASDTDAGEQLALAMFPAVTEAYRETFQNAAHEWM